MFTLLDVLLRRIIQRGELVLTDAGGVTHRYGDGMGPRVAVRLADRPIERHLVRDPQLALGEAYMDGRLIVEEGRIYDLLELILSNAQQQRMPAWTKSLDATRYLARRLMQFNPAHRSRRNVARHYDIDGAIYDLFLDADRQYSCAYFMGHETLEEAQLAKPKSAAFARDDRGNAGRAANTSQPLWAVQVGAFAGYSQAYEAARQAVGIAPEYLSDGALKVVPLKKANGRVLQRARIEGISKQQAYDACRSLKKKKMNCMEMRLPDDYKLAANES